MGTIIKIICFVVCVYGLVFGIYYIFSRNEISPAEYDRLYDIKTRYNRLDVNQEIDAAMADGYVTRIEYYGIQDTLDYSNKERLKKRD